MILKRFYTRLLSIPDTLKIIIFAALILAIGAIIYFLKSTPTNLSIAGLSIAALLLLTKPIWLPDTSSPKIFRGIVLGVLEILAMGYGLWKPILDEALKDFIKSGKAPAFLKIAHLDQSPTIIFSILLVSSWLINKLLKDNTGMGKSDASFDKDIKQPDFKERLANVCASLNDDLRSIDIKTNWSAKNFVPLDAEVAVQTDYGKKKKVGDLLKSIRSSDSRLFLVLGDPGSGKSVALRKLCQDLSAEVKATQKIPIYINLKEWQIEEKWDAQTNPPTVDQLQKFIISNIKSRDIVLSKFFDKYFDVLHETGRLFYVLDSFDEIPAVLEEKENSELIRQLSRVFYKFLKGGRTKESQGILSSRIFRKPTAEFQTTTTLEIRPFSEEKIIKTLQTSGVFDKTLIKSIFRDRPDLVPIIRNPFMARLLTEFLERYPTKLPQNQSELFEEYIGSTLNSCDEKMRRIDLSKVEVVNTTIEIADFIFKNFGLEARTLDIKDNLTNHKIDQVIDILTFSRIGRLSTSDGGVFSFSHRRFCEYFAVQKRVLNNAEVFDLNSIPSDSQWRDALVLYCEVAEYDKAKYIANFCWAKIKKIDNSNNINSIHCMRFLRDAFKGRKECLVDFIDELNRFTLNEIELDQQIITAKLAIESIGLLEEKSMILGMTKSLALKNGWIQDTAIKSCRHIATIDSSLENMSKKYIYNLNII